MSIKLELESVEKIESRFRIQEKGEVQKFFTNTCARYMDEFTPYKDGNLRLNKIIETDQIVYESPYAHYQHMGILYIDPETKSSYARKDATKIPTSKKLNYHTDGTGSHWEVTTWESKGNQITKETQDFLERRSTND